MSRKDTLSLEVASNEEAGGTGWKRERGRRGGRDRGKEGKKECVFCLVFKVVIKIAVFRSVFFLEGSLEKKVLYFFNFFGGEGMVS